MITRLVCSLSAVWSAACAVVAAFLLSSVPLVRGESVSAAGLVFDADVAYATAGSVFLFASVYAVGLCLFGLHCIRFVRHIDALRAASLFGSILFLAALVACLAIGRLHDVGWTALIAAAALYSLASLAGEMSRALIAARMRREALDG